MKNHIMKTLVITAALLTGLVVAGCGRSVKTETEQSAVSTVRVECGWEQINSSIEAYKFGEKYFIEKEYKEDEEALNSVYIYNYAPDIPKAFKNVPYQIMIAYGQADGYNDPVITVSLVDNKSKNSYYAVVDKSGTKLGEEGTWFPEEDKDAKLKELVGDAKAVFGLG